VDYLEIENLYDKFLLEILASFYYYLNTNIEKGILSDLMYHEIELVKQVAFRRGISLEWLYNKGSMMK
jgi:hypothetical protein